MRWIVLDGVMRTDVDDDGWWDGVERSKNEGPRNTPVVWGNDFALIFPPVGPQSR